MRQGPSQGVAWRSLFGGLSGGWVEPRRVALVGVQYALCPGLLCSCRAAAARAAAAAGRARATADQPCMTCRMPYPKCRIGL